MRIALFALLLPCFSLACSPEPTLDERLAAWRAVRPAAFVVELCHGWAGSANQCERTAVSGGVPLDAAAQPLDAPEPLEGLFYDSPECEVQRTFDPERGFVTFLRTACYSDTGDTLVDCFVGDTLDLDACAPGPRRD